MTDDLHDIPEFLQRTDFHKSKKLRTWKERMPVMPDKHRPKRWLPKSMDDVSRQLLREIDIKIARKKAERFAALRAKYHGRSTT